MRYLWTFSPVKKNNGAKRKSAGIRPIKIMTKMNAMYVNTDGCMPTTVWPTVWQYLHLTVIDLLTHRYSFSKEYSSSRLSCSLRICWY